MGKNFYFARCRIVVMIIFSFYAASTSAQQREYNFNAPGSKCYFRYLSFTADGDYSMIKRPFIFILGEETQTAADLFENDTLKNSSAFTNYYFVYLPGIINGSGQRLECIEALVSLLTYNYKYGKSNLFLQVNDTTIKWDDINTYRLRAVFKSIRLQGEEEYLTVNKSETGSIQEDFRESAAAYSEEKKPAEDFAKYYIEEESELAPEADPLFSKPQKTYFGPPEKTNYTLTGIIIDNTTGEALPFAAIQVKGTIIGTLTNADGYFTLLKVPADTCTLAAQYLGYEKRLIFLTPQSPDRDFRIELKQQSHTLQEVMVTAYKDDVAFINKAEVGTIKFTPVKMEQLPSIGEKDIMRSFQLMPGISASNESSSGLYVRGGTPDQNLVLYDGFTVYHVDHLYGFFSAFNSNALKDIQLFKGGFESRFGGRISSVTEITSKEGNQKQINFGFDVSLLSTNLFAEIPVGKKFTSFIAFRKSYQGTIYDMIFKKFNKSSTTEAPDVGTGPGQKFSQSTEVDSYFYDLNGKFTYRPTDKDIISLSIFNGTDKLDNSFASDIPSFGQARSNFSMNSVDLTKYGNIGSSLKWSRKWNSKLYGNTILSYSNYYNKRDRSSERTFVRPDSNFETNMSGIFENNDLKDYSIKSDYQWEMSQFSQIQLGVFGTLYDIKYSYAENDTVTILDRDGRALLAGIYVQDRIKLLKDKIQFLPGIRTDFFQTTGEVYFEPRASISFSVTDRLILKGSTGKFYQFANRVMREDIMSGSKEFWVLSDGASVPISSAIHYIAGVSYEMDRYNLSVEGYYKKISNLTEYSLRINANPMGIDYNENFFNGCGYAKGLEFLVQKSTGSLNGWISYTLGEAKNHFNEYSDAYFPANQDVTHEFKIVGLYKHKRWDFSANWIYATGRPYTAPSGAYTITLLDGTVKEFFTVTSKNSVRLPDYHRLDIAATYKLLMGWRGDKKRRELGSVSISLFNLYNRKNVWYKQYVIEDGEILETNVSYLGITPNITLSLKLR